MNKQITILVVIIHFHSEAATALKFISNYTTEPSLQVQLPDGIVQGRLRRTFQTGMPYYSYEGIPYAQPPVGSLRFQRPLPPKTWSGVLDADGEVPICYQVGPPSPDTFEDEDCLYINVYVPKPSPNGAASKAVMVWIYGGGFTWGRARREVFGPDYLLEKDVIVVHFNYRLNVFGFLATEDLSSPGNYGLKDQQLALRWINTNIHFFGGDPQNITLFGESAGGASVGYHLVADGSRGLFHRAISQSGSPFCTWALQKNPLSVARKIAGATGFYTSHMSKNLSFPFFGTTADLLQYLRKLKANVLKSAAGTVLLADGIYRREVSLAYSPVLEPLHEDAFLTQSTYEKYKSGDFERIPYLTGFNSRETAVVEKGLDLVKPLLGLLPNDLIIPASLNNKDPKIVKEIRDFYFEESGKSTTEIYIEFFSDTSFYRPILQHAKLYSNYASVYAYRFAYEGVFLGKKALSMEDDDVSGVSHTEDIWYIFRRNDLNYANSTDKLIRDRMITLWTNFAKYGDPTPNDDVLPLNVSWPRFEKDYYPYLNIDVDLTVQYNFRKEIMQFWEKLFKKYGRSPFLTY